MAYETDRIYALVGNRLHIRPTTPDEIVIDPASHLAADREDPGPLHVEGGLQVADFAVFLRIYPERSEISSTAMRVGYLVTEYEGDTDGSGILVGRSLLQANPSEWASGRVESMWHKLHLGDYSIGEHFELTALEAYLHQGLYGD